MGVTGPSALSSLPELQGPDLSHVGRAPQISPYLASSISFTHALLHHSLRSTELLTEHLLRANTVLDMGQDRYQLLALTLHSAQCSGAQSSPTLLRPHGLQPARLLCPWTFPGKNTGWVALSSFGGSSRPREPLSHRGSQIELRGLQMRQR